MITPILLLFLGLALVFIEFFLPGGIMGVAGGILIVASMVIFALNTDSLIALIFFIVIGAVLLGFLVKLALWRIKREKKGIYLSRDQEGYFASMFLKEMIGRQGEAVSDLKPAGHIQVEGKRLQAVSKTGYIHKGSKIEVVGGEGAHLIVKIIHNEKENPS